MFWVSLSYTRIGGTAAGTGLILMFLPALYAIWYRIKPTNEPDGGEPEVAKAFTGASEK